MSVSSAGTNEPIKKLYEFEMMNSELLSQKGYCKRLCRCYGVKGRTVANRKAVAPLLRAPVSPGHVHAPPTGFHFVSVSHLLGSICFCFFVGARTVSIVPFLFRPRFNSSIFVRPPPLPAPARPHIHLCSDSASRFVLAFASVVSDPATRFSLVFAPNSIVPFFVPDPFPFQFPRLKV